MEESLEAEQQYLRTEILDVGYNPQDFSEYICSIRGEENIDLENWTMSDLQKVVQAYKEQKRTESLNSPEITPAQAPQSETPQLTNETTQEEQQNPSQNNPITNQAVLEQGSAEIKTDNLSPKALILEIKDKIKDGDAFQEYNETINCVKLEPNEITDKEDLSIIVSNPVKKKEKVFSFSYYIYNVKTNPVNYSVERRLTDFEFIHQKLPLLNPGVFNPLLPDFPIGLKDDSPKKLLYLQEYMNSLIEIKYFRSLPIIYEFLTLPLDKWRKIKNEKYDKIKQLKQYENIQNLQGSLLIKIDKQSDDKATKIKDDISQKEDIFKDINSDFDSLLENFKKISEVLYSLSNSFKKLSKKYVENEVLSKIFNRLDLLFNKWNKDYMRQNFFFKNEIKYFFKFMLKENQSFEKNYDSFKSARDDYKKYFDKMRKNNNPSVGDLNQYLKAKKDYGFNLVQINEEYYQLADRQGKRAIKQFDVYYKEKNVIYQNYENCLKLVNLKENWDKNIEDEIKSNEDIGNSAELRAVSKDLSDSEA